MGASLSVKRSSQTSAPIIFDYLPPSVANVLPTAMDTAGTDIIITGSNFGVSIPSVSFLGKNGLRAGPCTVTSHDHANIECRSPPGRGDGVFSVFVTAGNQLSEVLAYAGFEKDGLLQVTYNHPFITGIVLPEHRSTAGNYIRTFFVCVACVVCVVCFVCVCLFSKKTNLKFTFFFFSISE